jgi:hypothetical protein
VDTFVHAADVRCSSNGIAKSSQQRCCSRRWIDRSVIATICRQTDDLARHARVGVPGAAGADE